LPGSRNAADEKWGESRVEEKAKLDHDRRRRIWAELQEKAKDDPELAEQLKAAKSVIETNREVLQRLADC
jgi:hypothetical protein